MPCNSRPWLTVTIVATAVALPGCGAGVTVPVTTRSLPPSSHTPPSDPSVAPYPDAQRLPDLAVTALRGGGDVRRSRLAPPSSSGSGHRAA